MNDTDMEEKLVIEHGTIKEIVGHPMSGLWTIIFEEDEVPSVHIESGYGIRTMVQCFGSYGDIMGKSIFFTRDSYGVLENFSRDEEDDN